jgi:deoxycytidine triphosphate deaminase
MQRITDIQPLLDGIVHWETQETPHGADLTVAQIFRLSGPGQLDFGGDEFAEASREQLAPTKAHPDDSYGWWRLDEGTYIARYNETVQLALDQHARLDPLPRLLRAGAQHPSRVVNPPVGTLETLLTVGASGCHIKENARISRLEVFGIVE